MTVDHGHLVPLRELCPRIKLRREDIMSLVAEGDFPRPKMRQYLVLGWKKSDIDAWCAKQGIA